MNITIMKLYSKMQLIMSSVNVQNALKIQDN